tara:strand:+ start:272 stop:703 length:432 start_codon:yes stop_codon:yes gene_type:complete
MGQAIGLVMAYKGMQADQAAAASERQQAQLSAEMSDISTQQDTVDRTKQLYAQLSSVNSSFSSSGLTGAGATKSNLSRGERKMAASDISSRKIMGSAQRRKFKLEGFNAKMKSKSSKYKFGAQVGKYASDARQSKKEGGSYLI